MMGRNGRPSRNDGYVKQFARRMLSLRHGSGLTQAELARELGCTPTCVCQYERAVRLPGLERASLMAQVLGTTLDELVPNADRVVTVEPGQMTIDDIEVM